MKTPKGLRTHIILLGKRNVGKSSLLNFLVNQDFSIVSNIPGTTTDPVEKSYEFQPVGPCVFIDTAGYDDIGELGDKRVLKTKKVLKRGELVLLVLDNNGITPLDEKMISLLKTQDIPFIIVVNKIDLVEKRTILENITSINEEHFIFCSVKEKTGFEDLKLKIRNILEKQKPLPPIISDLVSSSDFVVLVVPIDKEAPKGRLILPQVQTIRELLDVDIPCLVTKERELNHVVNNILKIQPKLVVTDSQVFLKVDGDIPHNILMTSFSILFARQKGDLLTYVKGLKGIDELKNGDKILIAELCSHKPSSEDIGTIKIPRWLKQYTGLKLDFEYTGGKDFPENLSKYKLIIQCGGCMVNRQLILSRIQNAKEQNIDITNYGVLISYLHGICKRALKPFPEVYDYFINNENGSGL
jgi:[FeFe] hydrogenase H-cluster maturation GTPase HydF